MGLESPILELPQGERREQLRRKLKEYAQRIEDYKNNLKRDNSFWHPDKIKLFVLENSDYMKIVVLSELFLTEGSKNESLGTYTLFEELFKEKLIVTEKEYDIFNQACGIIDDYCKTGGKNCSDGTGLK
ncbi:MAG: hypothetical protein ABH811_02935 [archaeon]